jgi:lipopolysaccharide export system protein LptA
MMIFFRIALFLSFWVLLLQPSASGQTLKKALGDSQGQPIVIKSNSLEFDHQRKMVTFSGECRCQEGRLDYSTSEDDCLLRGEGEGIRARKTA